MYRYNRQACLAWAILAATALMPLITRSERVANSFVFVEADGVSVANDGAFHFANVTSSIPVTVTARSGWKVNGRSSFSFVRAAGEDGVLKVTSKLGEDEEHIPYADCTFPREVVTNHLSAPVVRAIPAHERLLSMYARPETNVFVSASAHLETVSNGVHEIITTWLPCPECGLHRIPSVQTNRVEIVPGPDRWISSAAGVTTNASTWAGFMPKGLDQRVRFNVSCTNQCRACICSATTNSFVDVHELSVTNGLYLGLDRTDCGRTNPVVKVAGAIIDPEPTGSSAYLWTDCGICSFTGRTDQATARYFAPDPDRGSARHLAEPLTVSGTATSAGGQSDSANCTSKFTVVKVDVTIGGVGEDKEETEGAFVQYVKDAANGEWTEDGTNALVAVSITCEPENLPTNEVVTISAPAKSLYIRRRGKYYAISEETEFPAYLLSGVEFVLHGHEESGGLRDREIKVEHRKSGAVDLAKFTNVKLRVTNIKFNHDVSSSDHDAINIRRCYADTTGEINVANGEWIESGGVVTNEPFCYTTNRAVTVKARFEASGFITSAVIRATCAGAAGSLSSLMPTNVVFSNGVSSPEYFEFAMKKRTLNCIDRSLGGMLSWTADSVNGQSGCDMNDSGPHLVYTILGEPKPPWDNAYPNQKNAWTNALELVCNWAGGASAWEDSAAVITRHINESGVFVYDTANGVPNYFRGSVCYLTKCIDRINGAVGLGKEVNCVDCANFVVSLANVTGCELYSSRMKSSFKTNPYTAIGCSSWTAPSWGWRFRFHQVAWTESCGDSDMIFDACLRVDGSGAPNTTPRIEKLPVKMQFSDGSEGAPYVYRESLAAPGSDGYDKCCAAPSSRFRPDIK